MHSENRSNLAADSPAPRSAGFCQLPWNPLSAILISTSICVRWTMVGHHVSHGGYNAQVPSLYNLKRPASYSIAPILSTSMPFHGRPSMPRDRIAPRDAIHFVNTPGACKGKTALAKPAQDCPRKNRADGGESAPRRRARRPG